MPQRPRYARATLGCFVLLLAGCDPAIEPPATDYRQKYAIGVHVETVALTLPFAAIGAASDLDDQARLSRFAANYLDRGHGPIIVVAPREPHELRERLLAAGVPSTAIRAVIAETSADETLTLRYERYVTTVPPCGDWSGPAGRDPSNNVHSNFGCAMQSNLGVMVADPADLIRMREPTPTDTQNSNRVLRRYRAGEPPAAIPTPLQNSGAAGTTSSR